MKTAHRMTVQVRHNSRTTPQTLPKFWRPKLTATQRADCQLVHWDIINRITAGGATVGDLWDWMETGFTYHKLMCLLRDDGTEFTPEAVAAIDEQLAIYEAMAVRHARTGRAGFSGTELRIARAAAQVFDSLVQMDRHGLAKQAALWSMAKMAALMAA